MRSHRFPSASALVRSGLMAAATLAAILILPQGAAAQQCIGSPNYPGQFSVGGYATFQDGGNEYGVSSTANLESPVAIGARLGTSEIGDSDGTVASALGLFELPFPGFTACPVAELRWATGSVGNEDVDRWAFPLGVSAGMLYQLNPSVELLPSAQVGLMYARTSRGSQTDSATEVFLDAGATFSFAPFFARGEVGVNTGDESDAAFELSAGVRF